MSMTGWPPDTHKHTNISFTTPGKNGRTDSSLSEVSLVTVEIFQLAFLQAFLLQRILPSATMRIDHIERITSEMIK